MADYFIGFNPAALLQMAMLSWFAIMPWRSPSHYVWGLFPNWWLLTSLCKCLSLSPSQIPSWPQAWYQRLCHMMLKIKCSSGREVTGWGGGGDFFGLRCGQLSELLRPRKRLVERQLPGQRGKLDGWSGNWSVCLKQTQTGNLPPWWSHGRR